MLRVMWIIAFVFSILNAYTMYEKTGSMYDGADGWVCSAIWLSILIMKSFKFFK